MYEMGYQSGYASKHGHSSPSLSECLANIVYEDVCRSKEAPIDIDTWVFRYKQPLERYKEYLDQHEFETPDLVRTDGAGTSGERWKISFSHGVARLIVFTEYTQLLARLVSLECNACQIAFTGMSVGALPDNLPWNRQPWWRWKLWSDWMRGRDDGDKEQVDERAKLLEGFKVEAALFASTTDIKQVQWSLQQSRQEQAVSDLPEQDEYAS